MELTLSRTEHHTTQDLQERADAPPARNGDAPAWLAAVAGAGPPFFLLVVVLHSASRADHSLLALPMSALAAGSTGWVQDVNFVAFGLSAIALAVALHRALTPGRTGVGGPALLALGGGGLLLAAAFPARDASGAFSQDQVGHALAAVLAFVGTGVGFIVTSRRIAADTTWHGASRYTLASGAALLLGFIAFGALARPPDAPLHGWMGLLQLGMISVWAACAVALARRVRASADAGTRSAAAHGPRGKAPLRFP